MSVELKEILEKYNVELTEEQLRISNESLEELSTVQSVTGRRY